MRDCCLPSYSPSEPLLSRFTQAQVNQNPNEQTRERQLHVTICIKRSLECVTAYAQPSRNSKREQRPDGQRIRNSGELLVVFPVHTQAKMRSSATRLLRASLATSSANPLQRLAQSALRDKVIIAEEVADALHRGLPVVSLETAITSHGLPYEQAITSGRDLEEIIRKRGAVPATIGLLDGVCKIGLAASETERLANPDTNGREKWKVGRRDIAPAMLKRVDGGTTVSATSFLSNLVGIEVFVTG